LTLVDLIDHLVGVTGNDDLSFGQVGRLAPGEIVMEQDSLSCQFDEDGAVLDLREDAPEPLPLTVVVAVGHKQRPLPTEQPFGGKGRNQIARVENRFHALPGTNGQSRINGGQPVVGVGEYADSHPGKFTPHPAEGEQGGGGHAYRGSGLVRRREVDFTIRHGDDGSDYSGGVPRAMVSYRKRIPEDMSRSMSIALTVLSLVSLMIPGTAAAADAGGGREPVRLIFDTDMGNDIDDALALGVIHALHSRGECRLLAVTLSKDNEFSGPFVDLVNTFYGRGDVPVGVVRDGKTPADGNYIRPPCQAQDGGKPRYPHDLASGKDAPEAVGLLRQVLAGQPDGSVVIAVVGFSTNLARLLDSPPDGHSPLRGMDLVVRKCRLLSSMAGMFEKGNQHKEYNVVEDLPAARKVFAGWPTPIVVSGFEIGLAIQYPAVSIEQDYGYVKHHPLAEAYRYYMKMPYDRPTWDLTAVLFAVRPERGYFGLSEPGRVLIDGEGHTTHAPSPDGKHRYLTVTPEQIARVREALVQLASQPPGSAGTPAK